MMMLSYDLGIKRLLFLFLYFLLIILMINKNDFCILAGTDVAQFLFVFVSKYSEAGSLRNLNVIFNMPEAFKRQHRIS